MEEYIRMMVEWIFLRATGILVQEIYDCVRTTAIIRISSELEGFELHPFKAHCANIEGSRRHSSLSSQALLIEKLSSVEGLLGSEKLEYLPYRQIYPLEVSTKDAICGDEAVPF